MVSHLTVDALDNWENHSQKPLKLQQTC